MTPKTGLYIHWPFCARICPYCDFTITRSRNEDIGAWTDIFVEDLRRYGEMIGPRPLVSIYFGGGTPSLMPPDAVGRVIDAAEDVYGIEPGAEITLEANPTDAEAARFSGFASAGVNRLSLGVQSLDDRQLSFLGRNHGAGEARAAVEVAMKAFRQVTLDFIYALPDETMEAWRARLSEILSLGAGHLSLYQLTVEQGTAFGQAVKRGDWTPSGEDRSADLYDLTQEMTDEVGLPAYEVSNHARAGEEAVHNGLYWQGADWLAIGPGAHGRLTTGGARHATSGQAYIRQWPDLSFDDRYEFEFLDDEAQAMEVIAGALRTTAGLPLDRVPQSCREALRRAAGNYAAEGILEWEGDILRIAPKYRPLTDHLVSRLTSVL